MKISVKSIIVTTVVSCLCFGLGLFTAYKVNMERWQYVSISKIGTDVQMPGKEDVTPAGTNMVDKDENDPLFHLKMLQEDVEIFKALMEDVKNELFVTETDDKLAIERSYLWNM